MIAPIDIYTFRSGAFARNGDSVVCIGPKSRIDEVLGPGGLGDAFSGYALYQDSDGIDHVGVWGARNASRLRRLLREGGAEIVMHRASPPGALLRHFATRPGARG